MIDFALIGEQYEQASAKSLVCLATQSSVERVYSLAEASKQWQGPISVAVFVAGSDEFSILQYYVTYLRLCFDFIRSNVTFHLAFPYERQPERESRETYKLLQMFDCQYPEKTLRSLLTLRSTETKRWRLRNVYPQNHMRNLARKGCQTKYVFLTDVDIIPSANIAPLLNEFLETARYQQQIAISHKVTNYEFLYEPFYVAIDTVPPHDERFLGYGFTRNSQVYEMYVAGYSFYVLTPIFTCHWGLQKKNARPSWREQQNTMNRKRFETFKREILARYKKPSLFALEPKKIGRL
uniref:Beta-1,4-glucuronyltransferase 1 n=1 Tax=Glossina morsitans morsitans TaxID=37546 RepID=A0A1B0G7E5_GLOMM